MDHQERAFILQRDVDPTGVSGTGLVAYGNTTKHGAAWVHWLGRWATHTEHPQGVESVVAIHCHGGKTRLIWCDEEGGQPVLPWGDGRWVRVPGGGPFGEDSWIWTIGADPPVWNARLGLPHLGRLGEGDHLHAIETDEQVEVRDLVSVWPVLVRFMSRAKHVWVTRCVAECGGEPTAVKVSIG